MCRPFPGTETVTDARGEFRLPPSLYNTVAIGKPARLLIRLRGGAEHELAAVPTGGRIGHPQAARGRRDDQGRRGPPRRGPRRAGRGRRRHPGQADRRGRGRRLDLVSRPRGQDQRQGALPHPPAGQGPQGRGAGPQARIHPAALPDAAHRRARLGDRPGEQDVLRRPGPRPRRQARRRRPDPGQQRAEAGRRGHDRRALDGGDDRPGGPLPDVRPGRRLRHPGPRPGRRGGAAARHVARTPTRPNGSTSTSPGASTSGRRSSTASRAIRCRASASGTGSTRASRAGRKRTASWRSPT